MELAFGEYLLTALTMDNIDELVIGADSRPDSQLVSFLVKAPLGKGRSASQAQAQILSYIEAVPENGRAQMDEWGEMSLSVIGPDSFRGQITQAIAEDAKKLMDQMGAGYGVEIVGLNKPVQWSRSGLSEVLLYIPYKLTLQPRP